jgi:UDP-N-acetylglucosamine/UDP-N-acetylgalactosamine 4-epimerase
MNILLTGGAGFVGSNIAKALLTLPEVNKLLVLDNLSNGYYQNIEPFLSHPKFTFIQGDITDFEAVTAAMQGITHVSHQAALGSVPRSIKDPIASNNANINGTLHVLTAAKNAGVQRVVFAASSSTYGDSEALPKIENIIGKPLSPYAVTKYVMELYADVFYKTYGLQTIGLRYFNVFGPNQSPTGAYAAVIPLFMNAVIKGEAPLINGDGTNSRDFTYVDNVVQANIKALCTTNPDAINQIFNVAFGQSTTLNELYFSIAKCADSAVVPTYGPNRVGDIPHSLANIDKAKQLLDYNPQVSIQQGIGLAFDWYKNNLGYFDIK